MTTNLEELKRLAEAVVNADNSGDGIAESMDFMEAINPAAIMELIQQRNELLVALKDAHQVLRDWGAYIPSSTIQEDIDMLGIAIANAEKQSC